MSLSQQTPINLPLLLHCSRTTSCSACRRSQAWSASASVFHRRWWNQDLPRSTEIETQRCHSLIIKHGPMFDFQRIMFFLRSSGEKFQPPDRNMTYFCIPCSIIYNTGALFQEFSPCNPYNTCHVAPDSDTRNSNFLRNDGFLVLSGNLT